MLDIKQMKYYARIENLYYRLFSITEKYVLENPNNNYIKWATSFESKQGKILATYEHTVHPDKVQLKTNFKEERC